ncbi:MAG: hypothetical protein H0U04_07380 [Rubrobacter sp.]|nr:hypothetical protein [Rubrobacter sp.]
MNKELLLNLLLQDAEENGDAYLTDARSQAKSEELLLGDLQVLGKDLHIGITHWHNIM